jgi:hypothetical protein
MAFWRTLYRIGCSIHHSAHFYPHSSGTGGKLIQEYENVVLTPTLYSKVSHCPWGKVHGEIWWTKYPHGCILVVFHTSLWGDMGTFGEALPLRLYGENFGEPNIPIVVFWVCCTLIFEVIHVWGKFGEICVSVDKSMTCRMYLGCR